MRALAGCARDFLIAGPPAVPSKIRRVPFDVEVCGPVDCAPLGTMKSNAAKMINECTAVFMRIAWRSCDSSCSCLELGCRARQQLPFLALLLPVHQDGEVL